MNGRHKSPSVKERRSALGFGTPNRFITDLGCDCLSSFLDDGRWLSRFVGCNPQCVDKKVPSRDPDSVSKHTQDLFLDHELHCLETNMSFGSKAIDYVSESRLGRVLVDVDQYMTYGNMFSVFQRAITDPMTRRIVISSIKFLSDIISLDFKEDETFYFGPGSAYFQGGTSPARLDKTCSDWTYPNDRFDPFRYFSSELAYHVVSKSRDDNGDYPVGADVLCQVPKKKDVNRMIGIGSVVGIAAQHSVGCYIRSCMKRHGYDLDSMADKNKRFARLGSANRFGVITLDLEAASDSLSLSLVSLLLNSPGCSSRCRHLFSLLMGCRSDKFQVDNCNDIHLYEKFSPMGSGFTFELESLIFTALAFAVQKELFWAHPSFLPTDFGRTAQSFGDDIVICHMHTSEKEFAISDMLFSMIVNSFCWLGLTVNSEKSFFKGSFRESCGGDFQNGMYIRGFYHHRLSVSIWDVIRLHNFFAIKYNVPEFVFRRLPFIRAIYMRFGLDRMQFDFRHCVGSFLQKSAISIPTNVWIVRNDLEPFDMDGWPRPFENRGVVKMVSLSSDVCYWEKTDLNMVNHKRFTVGPITSVTDVLLRFTQGVEFAKIPTLYISPDFQWIKPHIRCEYARVITNNSSRSCIENNVSLVGYANANISALESIEVRLRLLHGYDNLMSLDTKYAIQRLLRVLNERVIELKRKRAARALLAYAGILNKCQ